MVLMHCSVLVDCRIAVLPHRRTNPSPQDLLSHFSQALTQLRWNASICLENEIYSGFEKIFSYSYFITIAPLCRVMTLIMPTALQMCLPQAQYRKAIYEIISIMSDVQCTGFYSPDKVGQELFNNWISYNGLWYTFKISISLIFHMIHLFLSQQITLKSHLWLPKVHKNILLHSADVAFLGKEKSVVMCHRHGYDL